MICFSFSVFSLFTLAPGKLLKTPGKLSRACQESEETWVLGSFHVILCGYFVSLGYKDPSGFIDLP